VLIADHISKSYEAPGRRVDVLKDVSLTVDRGDAVVITGPSGCGKSTLLYAFGALEPPTSGTVTIDGTNPYALSDRDQAAFRGATIGFVFQDHLLLPQLSALENVLVPTVVVPPGPGRDTAGERARTLLEAVGLERRLDHRPAELSGGERQRVAIARALIRQPSVLLCDEPTGNLDRATAEAIADLLAALYRAHETTLVVVTHSAALASRFGRRYELRDGRL
jgi:lipoprotein-releasing system ATP-binding protein